MLDAARARSFSCYGYARETTPRIDGLARGALLFDNAFSPAPYTRAAMTSLWTSREPGEPGTRKALRLSELLAAQGIHTAGVVGNPNAAALLAFDRGFAEFHEVDDPTRERAETLLPTVDRILETRRGGPLFLYVPAVVSSFTCTSVSPTFPTIRHRPSATASGCRPFCRARPLSTRTGSLR